MKIDKPYRRGVDAAVAVGWALDQTKGGHLRLTPPEPIIAKNGWRYVHIVFPATASDKRSVKNFEADLRRCGVSLP